MALVAVVAVLALLEYFVFVFQCGRARGRLGVAAPAITGNTEFERYYRVQLNTVEQLVIFLPALFLFAHFLAWHGTAAGLGVVFVVGRALYARAYVTDPARRGPGFGLTLLANALLLLGALVGALRAAL
jgi:uncharacterized membrane protein YecN with MAPEG domain